MNHATPTHAQDRMELDSGVGSTIRIAAIVAAAGLVVSLLIAAMSENGFARFYHAYLVSYAFVLSIALGSLFFVMIQHLTRASWSVVVRRLAEANAATLPVLAIAFIPIAISIVSNNGQLYPWAKSAHSHHEEAAAPAAAVAPSAVDLEYVAAKTGSEAAPAGDTNEVLPANTIDQHTEEYLTAKKSGWLNPGFFIIRVALYFVAWSGLAIFLWRSSAAQDKTGELNHTFKMQTVSAPGVCLFAITITFGAFDLLMSLSPAWYSTIFGVYFFTGAMGGTSATLILVVAALQKHGYLTHTITKEHYHDMGKFLFGFVFFWGYIAFSQYMLIWYANLPETTFWFAQRGASTNSAHFNGWSYVSLLLPICHFGIPFAGLLSRHIKRNNKTLIFWAVWVLVIHWIDLWWIVMPEFNQGKAVYLGLPELGCLLALGGLFVAAALRNLKQNKLVPVSDPRLTASLAFENI